MLLECLGMVPSLSQSEADAAPLREEESDGWVQVENVGEAQGRWRSDALGLSHSGRACGGSLDLDEPPFAQRLLDVKSSNDLGERSHLSGSHSRSRSATRGHDHGGGAASEDDETFGYGLSSRIWDESVQDCSSAGAAGAHNHGCRSPTNILDRSSSCSSR